MNFSEQILGFGVEPKPHQFDMYYKDMPVDLIKEQWPDAKWICDISVESYDPVLESYRWSARPVSWWQIRDKSLRFADNITKHMYVGLWTSDTTADADAHWRAVYTSDESVFSVNAIINRRTGEILWSRYGHDCVHSSNPASSVFIDGGNEKTRWSKGFAGEHEDWLKITYNVKTGATLWSAWHE